MFHTTNTITRLYTVSSTLSKDSRNTDRAFREFGRLEDLRSTWQLAPGRRPETQRLLPITQDSECILWDDYASETGDRASTNCLSATTKDALSFEA
jgi:hypothetical protein